MPEQEDRVRREEWAKGAAAPWTRVGGSSHNSAVFNCPAHAPAMNIALFYGGAPGGFSHTECRSNQVEPAPAARGASTFMQTNKTAPDHLCARLGSSGDGQVTGNRGVTILKSL